MNKDSLEGWVSAIRDLEDFQKKYADSWRELSMFYYDLNLIRDYFTPGGVSEVFLREFADAKKDALLANASVWRELQQKRAQAGLELRTILDTLRSKIKAEANIVLLEIPRMLQTSGLDSSLADEYSKPVKQFMESIDSEDIPFKIIMLPSKIEELKTAILEKMTEENKKRKLAPSSLRSQLKEIVTIRISTIVPGGRIGSSEEWRILLDRLNDIVKRHLRERKEVELV